MKTVLLACRTIEEELGLALQKTGSTDLEVRWVQSGLHNTPDKLRLRIQEELDKLEHVDRVLLGFGFCGNAVLNLEARDFELILPRVDDCITLMLGSYAARTRISAEGGTYFLTHGWLQNESNIYKEYEYAVKKYGQEIADDIYKTMLAHYTHLGIIDTGAYDFDLFIAQTKPIAKTLGLEPKLLCGTLSYIEKLLTGPWTEDYFVRIARHESITAKMLDISKCI